MHRCDDCKIILDDNVRYCPKCGSDLSSSASSLRQDDSDVISLLASANLCRIRAEWDEAIAAATDALRLAPRDPDIASLLGSIYEERGMLDEAMIWYQMALELNPSSVPDQERLDRVSKLVTATRRGETQSFRVFEKRTKIWAWALGAVFVLIVALAIATTLVKGKHDQVQYARPMRTSQSPSSTPPIGQPRSSLPRGPEPSSESTKPAATEGMSSLRTSAEADVRTGLSMDPDVAQAGVTIDDVIADPRTGVATVTFTVPYKGVISREQIARPTIAVARKTFELHREIKYVTTRCLIQIGVGAPQVAFVGDIARQSAPPNATDQQVAASFTRPWWNPQIRD